MKPGYLTTEFLVTVLVVIAAVALCIADKIDGTATMATIGAVTTGYSLSRGAAKINPVPTQPDGPVD
jgi:hypothetical protein